MQLTTDGGSAADRAGVTRPAGNDGPGGRYDGTYFVDWECARKSPFIETVSEVEARQRSALAIDDANAQLATDVGVDGHLYRSDVKGRREQGGGGFTGIARDVTVPWCLLIADTIRMRTASPQSIQNRFE